MSITDNSENTPNDSAYKGRLARKQAKMAVITAVVLGIFAATIELFIEYFKTIDTFDQSIRQVILLTEGPASIAALNLDQEYAKETLLGLSSFELVAAATIKDESDNVLYHYQPEQGQENSNWLSDLLFGRHILEKVPLRQNLRTEEEYIDVGALEIKFDAYVGGRDFIDRSLTSLLTGTVKNVIFVFALIYLFNTLITRPLLRIDEELNDLDLKNPEKARIGLDSSDREDEISHLASSINNLLVKLDDYGKGEITRAKENERLKVELESREEKEKIAAKHKEQLEESNEKLHGAMEELVETQNQLIAREKYASLGELVAGVAHELNTPIGIGITASSHIIEQNEKVGDLMSEEKLTRTDLKNYMDQMNDSGTIIQTSLRGAAKLIESFKHVAKDQTSEVRREFYIFNLIQEAYLSLDSNFKQHEHNINIICDRSLVLDSYPGLFSQVFFHLIQNSLVHAFDSSKTGEIYCNAYIEDGELIILYEDNGKGMPEGEMNRVFDPFYSTSRTEGNTGLGGTVLHNIVTNVLKGSIECSRSTFGGLRYRIGIKQNPEVMLCRDEKENDG